MLRKKGVLLLEFSISIAIFSIISLIMFILLNQIIKVEKIKHTDQKIYENIYYKLEHILTEINDRNKEFFFYNNQYNTIFLLDKNKIIYKKDQLFYILECQLNNKQITTSNSIDGINYGKNYQLFRIDYCDIEIIGNLLLIHIEYGNEKIVRVLSIR